MAPILLTDIGTYIPSGRQSNLARLEEFGTDEEFLREKIGTFAVSRKAPDEETSDLCVRAFEQLEAISPIQRNKIGALVVVTQNPDGKGIPHTSAIVHGKLGLNTRCATFDISLGCSGYVYGLVLLQSFMSAQAINSGVLITSDPYSKIVDDHDKNTTLLFGDAATASWLCNDEDRNGWAFCGSTFSTDGSRGGALSNSESKLKMDGRAVFNFSATVVPDQIRNLLDGNSLVPDDIDLYVFHQGSKFIVDTLRKRLAISPERVPIHLNDVGNTVSSSIPITFAEHMHKGSINRVLLSGFGVGLSWASCILERQTIP